MNNNEILLCSRTWTGDGVPRAREATASANIFIGGRSSATDPLLLDIYLNDVRFLPAAPEEPTPALPAEATLAVLAFGPPTLVMGALFALLAWQW